ncbi:hypothetical protein ACLOJK_020952 [Asimina triloba]
MLPAKFELEDGRDVVSVAVHPSGDDVVCSTANGCILLELYGREENLKFLKKDLPPLHDAGIQKCLAFSVDGSRFATGGEDGHLRVFEWPSLRILLDEPSAHKSFRDLDFSGSNDGDLYVVEVKKMEICHWSKKLHLGKCISSIEFCPSERSKPNIILNTIHLAKNSGDNFIKRLRYFDSVEVYGQLRSHQTF